MNITPDDSHLYSTIDSCTIVELPRLGDDHDGTLTVVENTGDTPLVIRRVYYLYDVPADAERGGHSHFRLRQLVVALSGSFDVTLDDGVQRKTVTLNRPYRALRIERGIWRTIDNFSSGAVCLVLASEKFSEEDYVRSYDRFLRLTAPKRNSAPSEPKGTRGVL